MKQKTRKTLGTVGAIWLAFAVTATALGSPADAAPKLTPAQERDPLLSRGRYLVEHVGLCADCHTPRDEKGGFITSKWLLGAPLPFQPTVPMPWSPVAPLIAGLPTMTEAQAITFMQTGKKPDGNASLPPMPEFRLNAQDASAVVAYLKSLAPKVTAAQVTAR
jgi:mono/diheme cytochrome c family protein